MKSALITGISGQDGSYLAEFLLAQGYSVAGVVHTNSHAENLIAIADKLELITGDLTNKSFVRELVSNKYDEIYNLASVSSVQSPWVDPVGTITSCGIVPLWFLEEIRMTSPLTKFFQASSAEMYGDPIESPQTETTLFKPRSPYGFGKLLAHEAVEGYRAQYGIFAVSGILFNHESPRRGLHFVTRKITSTLARIAGGSSEILQLGNMDAKRDWSFAGDIVRGMWLSLQHDTPGTYVFASGEVHSVREFVQAAAGALGLPLEWQGSGVDEKGMAHGKVVIEVDPAFFRPLESQIRLGAIDKAKQELDWQPGTTFNELAAMMAKADTALHLIQN